MNKTILVLMAGLALLSSVQSRANTDTHWREEFAYMTGKQAYVYAYPAWKFAFLRQLWIDGPQSQFSMQGTNRYVHYRKLADPAYQQGTSMNRDTLYSIAFADLAAEPLVFVMPPTPDGRYLSIELTDWYSDAFAYLSKRDSGDEGGAILVHHGDWDGTLPPGIDRVHAAPTPSIVSVGRTYSTNTAGDLKIANALQDGMRIYRLSDWLAGKRVEAAPGPNRYAAVASMGEADAMAVMQSISAQLIENPAPARDDALITQFGLVGIGPKAIRPLGEADAYTRRGLARAVRDGNRLLRMTSEALGSITGQNRVVNGWIYNPANWGRMAESGDFLGRAATQSFSGGIENWVEEAVKLRVFTDQQGERLNGSNRYTLRFAPEQIPQVDAFWSITLYDNNFNVVDTGHDRYAIRDIDEGLVYAADGSLTIVLQPEPPAGGRENWLPTPAGSDFNLFFRAYFPARDFIDQSYEPPGLVRH